MTQSNPHFTPPHRGFHDHQNFRLVSERLGISPRDERPFSISRAILAALEDKPAYGFEGEVQAEMRNQNEHLKDRPHSVALIPTAFPIADRSWLPAMYRVSGNGESFHRDLSTASASAGGYLVGTDNLGNSFIDLLRNCLMAVKMGISILPNLKGNVTIPKQTAAGTAYWLATDGTAITESQATLGQLALAPKTVGAYTEFTRQLLMQSNPSVDAMIAQDLASVIGLAVDAAIINGSGASGQPTGIVNTAGIGSVTGTTLGWAGVIEFMTDLAAANALQDASKFGYVTTPTVAALLMQRMKVASTWSPVWEGNVLEGRIGGFPAISSMGMTAGAMLAGDWRQIVLGEWGVLELATNPYAAFSSGIIGVRAMQSVDVGVRQAAAFSYATSIT